MFGVASQLDIAQFQPHKTARYMLKYFTDSIFRRKVARLQNPEVQEQRQCSTCDHEQRRHHQVLQQQKQHHQQCSDCNIGPFKQTMVELWQDENNTTSRQRKRPRISNGHESQRYSSAKRMGDARRRVGQVALVQRRESFKRQEKMVGAILIMCENQFIDANDFWWSVSQLNRYVRRTLMGKLKQYQLQNHSLPMLWRRKLTAKLTFSQLEHLNFVSFGTVAFSDLKVIGEKHCKADAKLMHLVFGKQSKFLQHVEFHNMKISEEANICFKVGELTNLVLQDCEFSDNQFRKFQHVLGCNASRLRTLKLIQCGLSDEQCTSLAKTSISNMQHLEELSLASNVISDSGIIELVNCLELNRDCLRDLDVSGNNIGVNGASALSKVIQRTETLEKVDISGNPIGDHGGIIIAEAMRKNRSIKTLALGPMNTVAQDGLYFF